MNQIMQYFFQTFPRKTAQVTPLNDVFLFPATGDGTIEKVSIRTLFPVARTNTFNLTINGAKQFSGAGRPSLEAGDVVVDLTGLDIDILKGDLFGLDIEVAGGVRAPLFLQIDYDDGITPGGGGGSSDVFAPSAKPGLPDVLSDYFDTGSLDPAWTRFQGAQSTLTIDRSALKLHTAAGSSSAVNGIFKALPAGDCTIITKILTDAPIANYSRAGIALFQDATNNPNTCKIIVPGGIHFANGTDDQTIRMVVAAYNNYSSFNTEYGSQYRIRDRSYYVRASRSGTNWTTSWSPDGILWDVQYTSSFSPSSILTPYPGQTFTEATAGFSPAEFGVVVENVVHGIQCNVLFDMIAYFPYAGATLLD